MRRGAAVNERRGRTLGKPPAGLAHYLRDVVNGSVDGVITTLAVVAGAQGAELEPRIGLILGAANLAADGLSMGVSNYLGIKAELEQTGDSVEREMPWRHGLATGFAFAVVGGVPLVAYCVPRPAGVTLLHTAVLLSVAALAAAGAIRARLVDRPLGKSIAEIVVLGVAASAAAYGIGALVARWAA
jgi:VIT1/CCC1 family predicted Fe2+/Mn2+ transporter